MYKFGTIVLIPFPFTNLTSSKLRPALIVSKTNQQSEDIIVAFITSRTGGKKNTETFLLKTTTKGFDKTGLKTDSLFRFDKIATLHKKLILGELGSLSPSLIKEMKKSFCSAFRWNS